MNGHWFALLGWPPEYQNSVPTRKVSLSKCPMHLLCLMKLLSLNAGMMLKVCEDTTSHLKFAQAGGTGFSAIRWVIKLNITSTSSWLYSKRTEMQSTAPMPDSSWPVSGFIRQCNQHFGIPLWPSLHCDQYPYSVEVPGPPCVATQANLLSSSLGRENGEVVNVFCTIDNDDGLFH